MTKYRIPRKLKKYRKDTWCEACPIAENMRELTYLASGGMMSYANYTYKAIEQCFYEYLDKLVNSALEEETEIYKDTLKACREFVPDNLKEEIDEHLQREYPNF